MKRHMNTQFLYFQGDPPLPEIQFCKYLEKKRLQEMQKYRKNDPDCIERDIILRINLIRGWDYDENSSSPPSLIPPPFEVFRLIRVSSNLVVRAFVDKILLPLVGFRRNYHAYCLMDCESGVPFGPTNSQVLFLFLFLFFFFFFFFFSRILPHFSNNLPPLPLPQHFFFSSLPFSFLLFSFLSFPSFPFSFSRLLI